MVVNNPNAGDGLQDSDGTALGPEALVYALFTVLLRMVERKTFRSVARPPALAGADARLSS